MEGGNTFASLILQAERQGEGLELETIFGDHLVAAAREGRGVSDPAGIPP